MNVQILIPRPVLQPYIQHYVYCEIGTSGEWTHSSMAPPACASLSVVGGGGELSIKQDGQAASHYESAAFIGQTTRFKKVSFFDRQKSLFVIFRPCGAYPLLGVSQEKCREVCLNLTDLLGSSVRIFEQKLAGQTSAAGMKKIVEAFLLQRLRQQHGIEDCTRLAWLVAQIRDHSCQRMFIEELCRRQGYSLRTLERRMKKIVGLTPKKLQRIMRFNAALAYIRQARPPFNWPQIACRFGYFDQTHFIKEFKLLYGATPANFATAQNRFLSNIAFPQKPLKSIG